MNRHIYLPHETKYSKDSLRNAALTKIIPLCEMLDIKSSFSFIQLRDAVSDMQGIPTCFGRIPLGCYDRYNMQ